MIEQVIEAQRKRWRIRRMELFRSIMEPPPGCRILDVGGTPDLWRLSGIDASVTLLNLPGTASRLTPNDIAGFEVIHGDICQLPEIADGYDMIFSNSVLEHVGSIRRQRAFSSAVNRGRSIWVQVPAPCFPIEVHCRRLFWWALPASLRRRQIRKWVRYGKRWRGRQMAGTRPISRERFESLFPYAECLVERVAGIPKSYLIYRR